MCLGAQIMLAAAAAGLPIGTTRLGLVECGHPSAQPQDVVSSLPHPSHLAGELNLRRG